MAPLRGALAELETVLDTVSGSPAPEVVVDPDEIAAAVRDAERVLRRIEALKLRLVACASRSDAAGQTGFSSTGAWLARNTTATGATGAREADLARTLHDRLPTTTAALETGSLSSAHAGVIARALEQLPDDVTPEEVETIETSLVRDAQRLDPGTLRKHARRALAAIERDRARVDEHEAGVLRSEEDRALARTSLTLHDNGDGTTTGHFTVPSLAGGILRKAIQQIAAPRRDRDEGPEGECPTDDALGSVDLGSTRFWAHRDWPHQYGLALVELLEHLPTDRLHGKVAATVVVTIDRDQLTDDLRAVRLDTGHDVSPGEARRIACNAGILPAVLGGASLPLDLGRASRFFSEAQRTALAVVYQECAAHGCDRPYSWCELHHQLPWKAGGTTNLADAVPLCGYHHRLVHRSADTAKGPFGVVRTDPDGHKTLSLHRRC